ncbi:uncharacterized protein LOC106011385 [Aplysia californica]|uniref:Uncharacterized protein LOC106011385 n=1 Tax=Aplysia californica TaxID=6500 RepID=A0ABM0ZX04_APLCA|nr:uncharacterized protein LOC106011385 [Aplysia californica]
MAFTFHKIHRSLCFAMIITGIFSKERVQYVLAFPKHLNYAVPSLAISPFSQDFAQNTEVTVTAPARTTSSGEIQTQEYTHNFTSTSNEQWLLNLEYLAHFDISGIGKKQGIVVTSTAQLVVQARSLKVRLTKPKSSYKSSGVFNVMPIILLSYEYLVVTECVISFCVLLVVNPEGINEVTIELKLEPTQSNITYKEIYFHSGQFLQESLGPLDVLQILAKKTDLTGTWVKAQRSIAVIAGADFDCLGLPIASCSRKDMTIEQLPPVSALAKDYILEPIFNGNLTCFVKIGYVNPSTTLFGLEHVVMNVDTFKNTSTSLIFKLGDMIIYLHASSPVLVLQYVVSQEMFNSFDYSAAVQYPISKWDTRAELLTFDNNNTRIIVAAPCKCIQVIKVGVAIEELYTPWTAKSRSGISHFCSREMVLFPNNTVKKIQINGETCSFSGFVLGKEQGNSGWIFPILTFNNTEHNFTTSEPVTDTHIVEKTPHSPTLQFKRNLCPCPCLHVSRSYRNLLNETVLSSETAAIQSYLHIPRENLSRRVRNKMSAIDHRPSSALVGFVVFAFICLPIFGGLILNDCYRAWRFLCCGCSKKRTAT